MPAAKLGNGLEINYDLLDRSLPLDTLFIHGNLASNTWFEPAFAIWNSQKSPRHEGRAIRAEWRGCGKSGRVKSEAELDMSLMAQDYIDLLEQLGVKKCNVVAHSTGAVMALMAMSKRPALFHKAVLLDAVGPNGLKFTEDQYAAFTAMSQDRAVCEMVMNMTIHNNDLKSPLFQRIVDDAFGIGAVNWHGIPHSLERTDATSDMAKVTHPVLVLHGAVDPIIPPETLSQWVHLLKNSRTDLVADHGHSLNVEDPSLFVKKVNAFLFEQ